MRLAVWSVALLAVLIPACASTKSVDPGPEFAPDTAYRRRVDAPPPTATAQATRPLPPVRRPPRRLTGSTNDPTWYPRSGRISRRWKTIVIHHSGTDAGSARTFDKYHREQRGWDSLGYHFVIGNGTESPDGLVEIGPRWHEQKHGAHCKTPGNFYNDHGIGICLVGDFTKSRPTPRQLAALNRLVAFLSRTCDVPPAQVRTHGDINRKTLCPGKYFALSPVHRYLHRVASGTVSPGPEPAMSHVAAPHHPNKPENDRLAAELLNRDPVPAEGYNMTPITGRTTVR